MLNRYAKLKC
uniref:Uncharacterized protein n=1 Tax=Anguilla anguilla TaxID=7936 RepID=A0A0E9RCP9_ANGAN